jgi:hypothetical protein
MLDDRLDDLLNEAARDYNNPPETPREAIWDRIVAERAADPGAAEPHKRIAKVRRSVWHRTKRHPGSVRAPARPTLRRLFLGAGIAAVLALGIGLGRLSTNAGNPTAGPVVTPAPVATQTAARGSSTAYQLAATEYLSQSEAFLTLFRASVRHNAGNERLGSATARQLLATNRLLLDSPAGSDAKTRLLLQDLELVLAEIAQLSPESRQRDLDLITEGLERGGVMSRLRTAVPSGPSTTQGAL